MLTITRLFRCYQIEAHPFSSSIADIEAFELELCEYLEGRDQIHRRDRPAASEGEELMLRRPVSWIGRLFAVLACGIQFSDSTLPERRKRSSNYGKGIFQVSTCPYC